MFLFLSSVLFLKVAILLVFIFASVPDCVNAVCTNEMMSGIYYIHTNMQDRIQLTYDSGTLNATLLNGTFLFSGTVTGTCVGKLGLLDFAYNYLNCKLFFDAERPIHTNLNCTDDCPGNNCTNNSSCVDGFESYSCNCSQGYSGQYCEQYVGPCLSHNCTNNSTCVNIGAASYTCNCTEGYSGQYCEQTSCSIQKSCECSSIPFMDISNLSNFAENDTEINATLNTLATFDKSSIENACKDAQCNEVLLSTLVEDLNTAINTTELTINITITEKTNIRLAIDCQFHPFGERNYMFKQYEALCERVIILRNVVTDLIIKRDLVVAENDRCQKRSWLRSVMESLWHK